MKITDEAVEAAARVLVPVWFGGFEDQSEEGFPGTPNRRAINTARDALEAALPHLSRGAGGKDGEPPTDAEAKARLAEIVAKNPEDFGPGTNPLGDTKDGPEVVGHADPETLRTQYDCFVVSRNGNARYTVALVRQSALTACQQEVERLRNELEMWRTSSVSNHRYDLIATRNAELVKALEASRRVLAKLLSAGHNSPSATPEEIDAAFWSVDAALGGRSNE